MTEPEYFTDLKIVVRDSLVEIEISDSGGDPKWLVERAVERQREADRAAHRQGDENVRFDQIWCVVDVDQHPRLPAARQQARDNGIGLAVSNPCFELWALLHFRSQTAHLSGREAARALNAFIPNYNKRLDCTRMRPGYPSAVARARDLERMHELNGAPGGNPSTDVWRLTESIHEEARKFSGGRRS